MKVPISWLKEYVDTHIDIEELAHRLTMAGNEVDSVERHNYIEHVVVGEVLSVSPHPNADRLRVVRVNDGDAEHEVVCGAPNVAAGQKIAFASVGAELVDAYSDDPNARRRLKKSKIRGVASAGMVCSERELGIGEDHDGILVLPEDSVIGAPIGEVIGEIVLDLELTPNRPDCLGVVGVARDVAALTDEELHMPSLEYDADGTSVDTLAQVTVSDPDLSPRYMGAVISGVKIGPSPDWLKRRLLSIGERPINNVVDATNFVMFELGQPLHAFDYDKVVEHHVIVRRAKDGESITTLDGVERKLDADSLLIADRSGGIGLAGIMGGENSEITDETVNVFLESANFNAENNRKTAGDLELRSEATLRFEKGLRAELTEVAIKRCVRVILEVAGGVAASGLIDEWPGKGSEQEHVDLSRDRIRKVMGVDYSDEEVEGTLRSLGFEMQRVEEGVWRVAIPYWRSDISIPEDLVEELARIIGYDELPATMLRGATSSLKLQPIREMRLRVIDALASQGMRQAISHIATSQERESCVNLGGDMPDGLSIENPVSAQHAVLRRTLRAPTLESAARNTRTWRKPIAIFEAGRVFLKDGDGSGLPSEPELVVGVLTGPRLDAHWDREPEEFDFFDAKGVVEHVLDTLGIDARFIPTEDGSYADGQVAAIESIGSDKSQIGTVGMVHPDVWERFDPQSANAVMFELDINVLSKLVGNKVRGDGYRPHLRYPEAARDLALIMDSSIQVESAMAICRSNRLVQSVSVFDVYEGEGVADGKKSVGLRIVYQSRSGTLRAEQVSRAESQIVGRLSRDLGATLRQ